MIIGGLLAPFAPFMASLVVEVMVAAAFLVGGIVSLVQVFRTRGGRTTYPILGLISAVQR